MQSKYTRRGFTLIELLVVVLIIGILAGVALPQYQKAVAKSRYATLKNAAQSIYEAEKVYYLENGVYSTNFDDLDIDVGQRYTARVRYIPGGNCVIQASYLYCQNDKVNISYLIKFTGKRYCVGYSSPLAKEICKQETNNATQEANTGWFPYP